MVPTTHLPHADDDGQRGQGVQRQLSHGCDCDRCLVEIFVLRCDKDKEHDEGDDGKHHDEESAEEAVVGSGAVHRVMVPGNLLCKLLLCHLEWDLHPEGYLMPHPSGLVVFVLVSNILPHHVEHCGTDQAVLDGAREQERRRAGQEPAHHVTPQASTG